MMESAWTLNTGGFSNKVRRITSKYFFWGGLCEQKYIFYMKLGGRGERFLINLD